MIHTEIISGMNTLTVSQHGLSVTVCDDEGEFHRHEFDNTQALSLATAIIEHCAEWKPMSELPIPRMNIHVKDINGKVALVQSLGADCIISHSADDIDTFNLVGWQPIPQPKP